ncbi:phage tail protein [Bradyrhizobium japonicum]|uniref:phage tail protein n=1 Tax=Bradyrhizobium japonicum TaxID=375 RepID=UPI001BA79D60|nr:tail fiber protein [Bradyrhizobium japonicum]MBR0913131.1 tail fiber protein [Bradyrhizobium japonicum]
MEGTTIPRDSNGNYSLPAGYQAIPGDTIQASQHNPPLEDLAASMTDSLPRNGSAPMTGPMKVQPGSAISPSIAPSNNPAIGFWFDSNGVHVTGNFIGARYLGELIPWTRLTAPALCVLPYGQTLLRSAYPDLWTVAQAEIAAGNTFYNNGNGSTTFGIGDCRGRVLAGKDNMGGTYAGRLTGSFFGTDSGVLGSVGGLENHPLTTPQMPAHFHSASIFDPGHSHGGVVVGSNVYNSPGGATNVVQSLSGGSTGSAFTGVRLNSANGLDTTNSAGSGAAHNNVQPTMVCNFALYAGA